MAYSEDSFPSAGAWDSQAYNGYKFWPYIPMPANYEFTHSRLGFSNYSHNGRKFTRRSSFAKSQVTFEYPPLNHDEFIDFHSVALAAQGQYNPFQVYIKTPGTGSVEMFTSASATAGDYTLTFSGLPLSQTGYFKRGDLLEMPGAIRNGSFNVVVADADTDGAGVCTVRLAYPIEHNLNIGFRAVKNTEVITATLADNGFEYDVDEAGFYYLTVTFDLDEFK